MKTKINLDNFPYNNFPLKVLCIHENILLRAILVTYPKDITACCSYPYIGWVYITPKQLSVGAWNAIGNGTTDHHTVDIIKIGWEPDFNWNQLPACVKYITRNPIGVFGSGEIALWENHPTFSGGFWQDGDKNLRTIPVRWLGLEDWQGGPEAILKRT